MRHTAVAAEPEQKRATGRFILIGVVAGLVVALALLALEALAPKLRGDAPGNVATSRHSFAQQGFSIAYPKTWDALVEPVNGKAAVSFEEPVRSDDVGRRRGFRVVAEKKISLAQALVRARERTPAGVVNYDEIRIVILRVGGRPTIRHVYTADDEFKEEWWIERAKNKDTFHLEFFSPVAELEEATQLNARIAESFKVL